MKTDTYYIRNTVALIIAGLVVSFFIGGVNHGLKEAEQANAHSRARAWCEAHPHYFSCQAL